MAVGLASGLAAIAFAALLPDAVAYIYLGAQLAGIGWVYFGFGVADGRPSAVAVQVLSAGAFLTRHRHRPAAARRLGSLIRQMQSLEGDRVQGHDDAGAGRRPADRRARRAPRLRLVACVA
jgi:hypothetical protein